MPTYDKKAAWWNLREVVDGVISSWWIQCTSCGTWMSLNNEQWQGNQEISCTNCEWELQQNINQAYGNTTQE